MVKAVVLVEYLVVEVKEMVVVMAILAVEVMEILVVVVF